MSTFVVRAARLAAAVAPCAACSAPAQPTAAAGPAPHNGQRAAPCPRPRIRSDTAFLVDVPDLVPENLAFDPVRGEFFVRSMARRRIYRVTRAGRVRPFAGPGPAFGQILGMKLDGRTRTLWVATEFPPDATAHSALLALDAETGALRHRYVPRDSARPHLFNDLVVTPGGDVYVTDSDDRAVYRRPARPRTHGGVGRDDTPGAEPLDAWYRAPAGAFEYPNGVARAADGRTLLVAYDRGVMAIDVRTKRARPVRTTAGVTLAGIDGLYTTGPTLVGVQVGRDRAQVIAARVDAARAVAGDVTVLECRHPAYDVPTTGALVGDTLFYIANSQSARLGDDGRLAASGAPGPTVVLRLTLGARPPR